MSLERIKELWADDEFDAIVHAGGKLCEGEDADEWVQEHKYQYNSYVFEFEGKFYQVNQSRSGSYHTDWYYNDTEIMEVTREEKVVTKTVVSYKAVKGQEITIPSRW